MDAPQAFRRMVAAAIRWRKLRREFRALDKARPATVDKAYEGRLKRTGAALFKAGDTLELSIGDFEKAVAAGPKAPIPWQKIFRLVSDVTGVVAGERELPAPPPVHAHVIDVTPE